MRREFKPQAQNSRRRDSLPPRIFKKTGTHPAAQGGKGNGGGTIVCAGTPEEVAACAGSYTGHYLKKLLETT